MVYVGVHATKISKVLDDKTPAKTLTAAIAKEHKALDINTIQIFTHGPRNSKRNKINYKNVKKYIENNEINLSVHSCYSSVGIWKVPYDNYYVEDGVLLSIYDRDKPNELELDNTYRRSFSVIEDQLASAYASGAWGLVLHITKHKPIVISNIMKLLKHLAVKHKVKIILEMVSSKACDKTYETPDKINELTNMIDTNGDSDLDSDDADSNADSDDDADSNADVNNNLDWWCWCVDTAHLHGAGVDIQSYDSMKTWISEIENKEKIKMFHLNGSSAVLGSGKDKHEIAFTAEDNIWHGIDPDDSGLKAVVEFSSENDIVIICEINRGDEKDTHKLLKIINKIAQ